MKIETYEVTEVAQATMEDFEALKEMSEKLGLEGQRKFFQPDSDAPVSAYRKMTAIEGAVYGALLPQHTKLKDYSDAPIPLRVLQIAAHAAECISGAELYVWHPTNADIKDPLLVAQVGPSYRCERYILARWGDELEEFQVLVKKAEEIVTAECKAVLLEIQGKVNVALQNLSAAVYADLLKGKVTTFSFYNH